MTRAYVCVKISEYTPSWDWTCLHVYKISRVTLKFDPGRQFKNYQVGTTIPGLPTKYTDTHVQRKILNRSEVSGGIYPIRL